MRYNTNMLRWIAVLPAALLSGIAAAVVYHYACVVIADTNSFYSDYVAPLAQCLLSGLAFVRVAVIVAPNQRQRVANYALILLTLLDSGGVVYSIYTRGLGMGAAYGISAIFGGYVGFMLSEVSIREGNQVLA